MPTTMPTWSYAPRAETGHWRWEDHRHGHADGRHHQCGASPSSSSRGLLIVAPGLTIRDRLRVLQPNDLDSYYASRELMPSDMLDDLERAKIVITNYHAFRLRDRLELSRGGRALLQGRGEALHTLETEGQMLQRVMPELMGLKTSGHQRRSPPLLSREARRKKTTAI